MEFNTLFTGKNYIELERVDSTNNYAANLMKQTKVPDGTVILAHFQENGRGQMGNSWQSMAGQNIMTSLIFHLGKLNPDESFLISKAISLGLYETVNKFVKNEVCIKWPNDIYVEDQKIAGMLIENKWQGTECNSIVGIGLNVNQRFFGELHATSLANCTGLTFEIPQVLNHLLSKIERKIIQFRKGDQSAISANYLSHLKDYKEQRIFQTTSGELFSGKIIDVENTGHLIIEAFGGEHKRFLFKEVNVVSNM
ncbi:biotin--[acetyl-CoA-carboxylase] ligase [Parvicella tangerina]|uniref:Bifunctional ligase/repressor BirA n=1 Tax=Parvicella tangerina TaxID=2829795 RepID=A0A916JRW4_9FLAO|nr:biotin--[acetyl-CoA-carboxylase] ligase [Parvicella tangerina]CAG5086402.1 Bifunctional ligase/repressor BirA [Parvicella tangerina]